MQQTKGSVNIIVAMAKNRAIGKDNQLLWHLPNDLKFFKASTMGCPIIMGRKTYESIGRFLPGRENVIVTRDASYKVEGATMFSSISEALRYFDGQNVFIIGGGEIYKQTIHLADKLYITEVDVQIEGDTYFPDVDKSLWSLESSEPQLADDKNKFNHSFNIYSR